MRRIEAVEKIQQNIENNLEKILGALPEECNNPAQVIQKAIKMKDSFNNYSTIESKFIIMYKPQTFDYEQWKAKREKLIKEKRAIEYLLSIKNKLIKIEERTTHCSICYANWIEKELTLKFSMKDKFIEYCIQKSKIEESKPLNLYAKALEAEIKETEKHISWLEEPITTLEEIFNTSRQKAKVQKRKLNLKNQ